MVNLEIDLGLQMINPNILVFGNPYRIILYLDLVDRQDLA